MADITREELNRVVETLESLIAWMAQSANSPISRQEAVMLLEKLKGDPTHG